MHVGLTIWATRRRLRSISSCRAVWSPPLSRLMASPSCRIGLRRRRDSVTAFFRARRAKSPRTQHTWGSLDIKGPLVRRADRVHGVWQRSTRIPRTHTPARATKGAPRSTTAAPSRYSASCISRLLRPPSGGTRNRAEAGLLRGGLWRRVWLGLPTDVQRLGFANEPLHN